MRAVRVDRWGGPEVLGLVEMPDPTPGPGEVLVAVAACDVLYVDTMVRSGAAVDVFPIRPPYVPGNGVGGEVVAVGDGVDESWRGRSVVAHTGGPGGCGGYLEQAVVPVSDVVEVPEGADLLDAVAVLHDGPTALRVLRRVGVRAGEPVLVLGAAGGSLGSEAFGILRDGGRFSAHGAPSGSFAAIDEEVARRRHVTVTTLADLGVDAASRTRLVREMVGAVADGKVSPLIGQTFPLEAAAEAHAAIAAREAIAKTLLLVD